VAAAAEAVAAVAAMAAAVETVAAVAAAESAGKTKGIFILTTRRQRMSNHHCRFVLFITHGQLRFCNHFGNISKVERVMFQTE